MSQRARGEVKSDSKEHAVSESDYKGTAAGTVLGGKHGTGGRSMGMRGVSKQALLRKSKIDEDKIICITQNHGCSSGFRLHKLAIVIFKHS